MYVGFTLSQATKDLRESSGIALLYFRERERERERQKERESVRGRKHSQQYCIKEDLEI